ncbi:MAG: isoprenylcysteine carboxylmethyltransferase family protein [Opitutus sp.]|nr:isoprenylcysteine carboxylmethyltransferase family protein [Opitutus sp.]
MTSAYPETDTNLGLSPGRWTINRPIMTALDSETGCRVALGLIMAGAVAIGLPHRLRADRAGGRVSPRVDPVWFWILMGIVGPPVLLAGLGFLIQPRWVDFARIDAPAWLRLMGAPIALAGMALFGSMFRHLGLNVTSTSMPRDNATLVTTGPYRWIRHPMYSAALIMIVATSLLTANAVVALGGVPMFALLAARSRVEERRLVGKFGDAYRIYQHRTGRFLPRLPRRFTAT